MKQLTIALLIPLVAGCGLSRERAKDMFSYDLCAVVMSPQHTNDAKNNAMNEIRSRNFDCNTVAHYIRADQAAERQALNNYTMQQNQLRMQQQQIDNDLTARMIQSLQNNNRPTTCNSYRIGNSINTNCY